MPIDETHTHPASDERVEADTADTAPAESHDDVSPSNRAEGDALSEDHVREALKQVIDPELGINIVDLGLVYHVEISEGGAVHIEYTLTTMGCPIGPLIEQQMQSFLASVPGVNEVEPEMVLRPAWTPEMMSEEAKAALGYF